MGRFDEILKVGQTARPVMCKIERSRLDVCGVLSVSARGENERVKTLRAAVVPFIN